MYLQGLNKSATGLLVKGCVLSVLSIVSANAFAVTAVAPARIDTKDKRSEEIVRDFRASKNPENKILDNAFLTEDGKTQNFGTGGVGVAITDKIIYTVENSGKKSTVSKSLVITQREFLEALEIVSLDPVKRHQLSAEVDAAKGADGKITDHVRRDLAKTAIVIAYTKSTGRVLWLHGMKEELGNAKDKTAYDEKAQAVNSDILSVAASLAKDHRGVDDDALMRDAIVKYDGGENALTDTKLACFGVSGSH
jgi:hypothetical protein